MKRSRTRAVSLKTRATTDPDRVSRDFRVVGERLAQDFPERAGLDQRRAEAEVGKRNRYSDGGH